MPALAGVDAHHCDSGSNRPGRLIRISEGQCLRPLMFTVSLLKPGNTGKEFSLEKKIESTVITVLKARKHEFSLEKELKAL